MKPKRKHNLMKLVSLVFFPQMSIAVCGNKSNICLISHFIHNDDSLGAYVAVKNSPMT